jgi:DNA-binding transcriptional MerR regulator
VARGRADDEPLPQDREEAAPAGGGARLPPLTSFSITQLARRHGLSRSTLLYYDRIGLLTAAARSPAGYRRYSQEDSRRLGRIGRYRKAGLALKAIGRLLEGQGGEVAGVLAARLETLNEEIRRLREQQRFIVGLLGRRDLEGLAFMSREQFVSILVAGGFTHADMERWHCAFERTAPEAHQDFLEFLCIPEGEIRFIRDASARGRRTRRKAPRPAMMVARPEPSR